jgi:magnesium chelatase family protein
VGRISGPLLDRIDLHLEVPGVPFQELSASADGTCSASMREQVSRVRAVQRQRFGADNATLNSRMTTRQLRRHRGRPGGQ